MNIGNINYPLWGILVPPWVVHLLESTQCLHHFVPNPRRVKSCDSKSCPTVRQFRIIPNRIKVEPDSDQISIFPFRKFHPRSLYLNNQETDLHKVGTYEKVGTSASRIRNPWAFQIITYHSVLNWFPWYLSRGVGLVIKAIEIRTVGYKLQLMTQYNTFESAVYQIRCYIPYQFTRGSVITIV